MWWIVGANANAPSVGDYFDHLIAHSMTCTSENDDLCATGHRGLMFELLYEVNMKVHIGLLEQGNRCLKQVKTVHIGYALNEA